MPIIQLESIDRQIITFATEAVCGVKCSALADMTLLYLVGGMRYEIRGQYHEVVNTLLSASCKKSPN